MELKKTAAKPKKHVFRVGDTVKIVNPEVFLRCGYPKTKQSVQKEDITPEQYAKIDLLLNELGLSPGTDYYYSNRVNRKIKEKIIDAISYGLLDKMAYGGREKQIYTENQPKLQDRIVKILSKKVVRTGKYVAASDTQSWDGEHEYCPAYLENVKSHVILELDIWNESQNEICSSWNVWIEEKNVVAV